MSSLPDATGHIHVWRECVGWGAQAARAREPLRVGTHQGRAEAAVSARGAPLALRGWWNTEPPRAAPSGAVCRWHREH